MTMEPEPRSSPQSETGPRSPIPAARPRLPLAVRALGVRLRFLILLAGVAVIMTRWETIAALRDQLWDRIAGAGKASQALSPDAEFFCPMDPGVVSDWPSKCPICNMTLAKRAKGDMGPLPDGVIARMQFSPYRVRLAGVVAAPVSYRPLVRTAEGPVQAVANAAPPQWAIELYRADAEGLGAGQALKLEIADSEPIDATIVKIEPRGDLSAIVSVAPRDPQTAPVSLGQASRAALRIPIADLEPFRSLPSDLPPLKPKEPRSRFVCLDHADVLQDREGACPHDRIPLVRRDLSKSQRLRWWCPMHPKVVADEAGQVCKECQGMALVPRVVDYRPPGEVLAVPEASVIDTGQRKVVYIERMSGMFDGVEVKLGPRCGDFYPVLQGLEPGSRAVASGAFLVDAETRLNPSLAAGYFGAAGSGAASTPAAPSQGKKPVLSPEDQARVAHQKICPVTEADLGTMGTPVRLEVEGRVIFICCATCRPAVVKDPKTFLAKLPPEPASKSAKSPAPTASDPIHGGKNGSGHD